MSPKLVEMRAGKLQLILVVGFILGALLLSNVLESVHSGPVTNDSDDRALFVETAHITPDNYQITFSTTGTVTARNTISVVPQVSGRIVKVHDQFFDGGSFAAGETLFEIDRRDFHNEVQRLEAVVAQARTALELEEAESAAALAEWNQINPEKNAPTLVARKPQMAEARANVSAARAQLANAKLDLERTRYSLPFDGRVIASNIALGQYVQSGQNYGNVFDVTSLEVHASLEDKQLEWLLSTEAPEITIESTYLGKTTRYTGYIKRGAATLDTGTRFATIRFGINETSADLLPGIFTNLRIAGGTMPNIARIPASAYQTDGKIWYVDSNHNMQHFVPDILYANSEHLAVRNLKHPADIVVSRVTGVTDGMAVLRDSNGEAAAKTASNESAGE